MGMLFCIFLSTDTIAIFGLVNIKIFIFYSIFHSQHLLDEFIFDVTLSTTSLVITYVFAIPIYISSSCVSNYTFR